MKNKYVYTFTYGIRGIFTVVVDEKNGSPWFNAQEIMDIAGIRYKKACLNKVGRNNMKTIEYVAVGNIPVPSPGELYPRNGIDTLKSGIFVSEAGLYQLIGNSQAKIGRNLMEWILRLVFPKIREISFKELELTILRKVRIELETK